MKITSCTCLLPIILLLTVMKVLGAVDDPCSSGIDNKIVADMCTGKQAFEDNVDGRKLIDSVIIRVMKQKANCTCRVSLKNNTGKYSVQMKRYRSLNSSVPSTPNCGLAIDVDYTDTVLKRNLDPIQCKNGTKKTRKIVLEKNGVIKLKSRIIGGNFTRGYCMQIFRDDPANDSNVQLNIQCDDPEQTTSTVSKKGFNQEDEKLELYIYIGAGAGGVLVIITILLIILCRRKKSKKKTINEEYTVNDSNDPDSDNGELKDNILYVSSDQQDIIEDGNYHMVDLGQKRVVNKSRSSDVEHSTADGNYSSIGTTDNSPDIQNKPKAAVNFRESDNQAQHISILENSNNEYAVVDKGRKSDSVKHASTLVRNSSEKDKEMSVIHVDQTYAVVDKTNRRKADE
ncbi:uncharacterized protein LOC127700996 [Mytilus californianus]|uniref:uncharacterized protein LOC127700996 n=1 Tax=Mytilus californianus TaxID=6549 RepID=UPI002245F478|nr:uncharacterized protein LOC127700996 [Mytilus californianus]